MLINKLTAVDRNMIESWITTYGSSNSRDTGGIEIDYVYNEDRNSLDHILRYWNANKQDLFQLLGETLIAERKISFKKSFTQTESEWYIKSRYNSIIDDFQNHLLNALTQARHLEDYDCWTSVCGDDEYRAVNYCFNVNWLLNNEYKGSSITIHPFGDENSKNVFKINKGEKVIKILGKLAKIYNLVEEFEAFRLLHSQVLNDAIVTGTMCLSIHPMDFITMSDNDYNWGSCMSWKSNGCYRAGTVEMMNSPVVAVAYLKGKELMRTPGGYDWNNKKWRELIIIDPKAIVNIKSYPYHNDELSTFVVDWARELAMTNMGWNFELNRYDDFFNNDTFKYHDGYTYQFEFWANAMYNDFNSDNTYHHIYISDFYRHFEDKDITCYTSINYSGELTCMWCGDLMDICYESDDTNMVLCEECQPMAICNICGEPIESSNHYYFDDEVMCYNCYQKKTVYDQLYGDTIRRDESIKIYLNPNTDKFDIDHINHMYTIDTHKNILRKKLTNRESFLSNCFNCGSLSRYDNYYYVNMTDLTDYGLRNFGLWSNWDKERYLKSFQHILIFNKK